MRTVWKTLALLLIAALAAACTAITPVTEEGATDSSVTEEGPALVVEDALGRSVEFAQAPSRIVVAGRGTYMVTGALFAFPAAQEKVAGFEGGRFNDPTVFVPLVDPAFDAKVILERNAGPEQMAPVQPDAIVLKTTAQEDLGASLEQLGIPIVYVEMESAEQYFNDLTTLGQLFDTPERADEIITFMQERLDRIDAGLADIADDAKPGVLVIQTSDEGGTVAFEAPPAAWLQTRMVEIAGGNPVWLEAAPGGGWATINFEQIAQWNPDKIFVIVYQEDAKEVVAQLLETPEWQALNAAQNGEIYGFPGDIFGWDSPDPRWILGVEWLATKIHPEQFGDIDMMAEVNAFFSQVYGMDEATIEAEIVPVLKGDLP
ncbi:MAG: ABC transporter substrate-binding protein [Caldilineaceae bacterium]|nr:ABC transporter substrate-binding protein [Caldilineaceae bacterium]